EEVQQEVLTQIVDINIQYQIGTTGSPRETLCKLLKLKYNKNSAYKYQEKLSNIRQQNYYTIRAYLSDIQKNCVKLSYCLDWNNVILRSKVEEVFFCGLHEKIQFEISRYDRKDFDSVFEKFINMERFILEKSLHNDNEYRKHETSTYENTYTPNKKIFKNDNRNNNKNDKYNSIKKKYCTFHRTNNHDNSECRARQKRKGNHEMNNTKNFLMNEPKPQPKTIKIPLTVNDRRIEAIVDTGSNKNYITADITELMRLNPHTMKKEEEVEIAD
ncbi:hypothetical protein DMUE_6251, partial [Dictyocoela muelleri]